MYYRKNSFKANGELDYDRIAEYYDTVFDLYEEIETQRAGLDVSSGDFKYLKELEQAVKSVTRLLAEIA